MASVFYEQGTRTRLGGRVIISDVPSRSPARGEFIGGSVLLLFDATLMLLSFVNQHLELELLVRVATNFARVPSVD